MSAAATYMSSPLGLATLMLFLAVTAPSALAVWLGRRVTSARAAYPVAILCAIALSAVLLGMSAFFSSSV